jgi:hypothetical protein
MIQLDHVVYVVENLDTTMAEIERKHGIVSIPGGIHPEGTANRLVPLTGSQYVEFITAHDPEACQRDDFGRRVLSLMAQGGGLGWWGVRTDRIESLASKAGLQMSRVSIEDPDGTITEVGASFDAPGDHNGALPFIIQYAEDMIKRAAVWNERFA